MESNSQYRDVRFQRPDLKAYFFQIVVAVLCCNHSSREQVRLLVRLIMVTSAQYTSVGQCSQSMEGKVRYSCSTKHNKLKSDLVGYLTKKTLLIKPTKVPKLYIVKIFNYCELSILSHNNLQDGSFHFSGTIETRSLKPYSYHVN
jgi:hypothetical protein